MLIVLIIFLILGFLGYAAISIIFGVGKMGVDYAKTNSLREGFSNVGDMADKNLQQIVRYCGNPTESYLIKDTKGESCYRRIWKSPKYEVTLIFETDDQFRAIEKEIKR